MIQIEDLDRSHDWDPDSPDLADPHSSGYQCRVCQIGICQLCTPEENTHYEEAVKTCPSVPWYEVAEEASET